MNTRTKRVVAVLVAGLLFALPALAADPPGADAHGVDAHGEAAHESPPLFSVNPGLTIWTIVTFIVVLIVLRYTAWGPLIQSLQEREKRISGAIEEAGRIKQEAEELLARHQTMMDQAKDEARGILDEARRDGLTLQEGIKERAQQEIDESRQRAHREIDLAKDTAVEELWQQAAGLSTELATRILGRTLGEADQERLVRELIEELRTEVRPGRRAEPV